MLSKFAPKRVFPCGKARKGKLQDHLNHYRECDHEACSKRAEAWKETLKKIGPIV